MVDRTFCATVAIVTVTSTAWDPAHTDSLTTLSGSNLTATVGSGSFAYSSTRSVTSHSSGKYYSEHTFTTTNGRQDFDAIGIGNANTILTNEALGANSNPDSVGWSGDNSVLRTGQVVSHIQVWVVNDVLCMAVDFDNNKVWFRTNGGNWNNDVIGNQDPANNLGGFGLIGSGPHFAVLTSVRSIDANPETVSTSNFGGSSYAQTPPSGFGNW